MWLLPRVPHAVSLCARSIYAVSGAIPPSVLRLFRGGDLRSSVRVSISRRSWFARSSSLFPSSPRDLPGPIVSSFHRCFESTSLRSISRFSLPVPHGSKLGAYYSKPAYRGAVVVARVAKSFVRRLASSSSSIPTSEKESLQIQPAWAWIDS
jgi:hypothetical protein